MGSNLYSPVIWLAILALVVGIFAVTGGLSLYRRSMERDLTLREKYRRQLAFLQKMRWLLWALAAIMTVGGLAAWYWSDVSQNNIVAAAAPPCCRFLRKIKCGRLPIPTWLKRRSKPT